MRFRRFADAPIELADQRAAVTLDLGAVGVCQQPWRRSVKAFVVDAEVDAAAHHSAQEIHAEPSAIWESPG